MPEPRYDLGKFRRLESRLTSLRASHRDTGDRLREAKTDLVRYRRHLEELTSQPRRSRPVELPAATLAELQRRVDESAALIATLEAERTDLSRRTGDLGDLVSRCRDFLTREGLLTGDPFRVSEPGGVAA